MNPDTQTFTSTYTYEPLRGRRYIRVLEFKPHEEAKSEEDARLPVYSMVQVELPGGEEKVDFEAISYTWGNPARVSALQIQGAPGHIGLTANLTEALPHFTRHSRTKRLWIDQLCINQADDGEKAVQIGLMSEIYRKAPRVIVWLGPEDESSALCKQWLIAIENLIPTMKSANRIALDSPEYHPHWRSLMLRDTFNSPDTDAKWAAAIGKFWSRMWFRRGWIVQEFLLAEDVLCLTGELQFSLQDLIDMFNVPADDNLSKATGGWLSYRILMQLKTDMFLETPQPLRFLRVMAAVAEEFETHELADRLFGFLGLLDDGLDFVPDYKTSVKQNFTRFAMALARDYGSLDFLSLWSANLDEILKDTPKELLGFPSWVPSYSATPLTAPWRLAVGSARSWNSTIRWNAAGGRRHVHSQGLDSPATGRLHVRGRIIDRIETICSARMARYWDVDDAYLTGIVTQLQQELRGFATWTTLDLVDFLNTVSSNGEPPRESAQVLLGIVPGLLGPDLQHLSKHKDSLAICLTMGRGRRFATTRNGVKALVPFIGSVAPQPGRKGSPIAVLHGCSVPVILQCVGEGDDDDEADEAAEWKVVGDCYVEGAMFGDAVNWEEDAARPFVLV